MVYIENLTNYALHMDKYYVIVSCSKDDVTIWRLYYLTFNLINKSLRRYYFFDNIVSDKNTDFWIFHKGASNTKYNLRVFEEKSNSKSEDFKWTILNLMT